MPCATYASQGVDLYHEGTKSHLHRSWISTDQLYCDNIEENKQILYVRSASHDHKIVTTSVPSSDLNEESYCKDSVDQSLDDQKNDQDYQTPLTNNNNNNNFNNYNLNKIIQNPYKSGIPVEAFPDSLIKWPPKNTTKSKRLEEIKKQVKQLSSIIKMTIVNESHLSGDASGEGDAPGNPAPFSKYVDMSLINSQDLSLSSQGASLPAWNEIKQNLTTDHYKEAKQMVRESDYGLNHQVRGELWLELCKHHSNETFTEQFYWDTVKQMFGTTNLSECHMNLPAFVEYGHLSTRALSQQGVQACQRIVSVIGFLNPSITYAPLVYPLTAIMLHYMEEVDVYNCMTVLINTSNNLFITQTKVNYEAMWRATVKLGRKHIRGSFSTLTKFGVTQEQVDASFQHYHWWILDALPLSHVIRVMDCFLLEGSKVLLRCALALMHIFSKQCSRDTTVAAMLPTRGVSEAILKFCSGLTAPPSKLLKTAFGIRGFSKTEINQVVLKTEMSLKSNRLNTGGVESTSDRCVMSRSASLEGLPTSASQTDVQMMSHTMTIKELLTVWGWLPIRQTMHQPTLLYTTEEHGSSLTTFYQRTEKSYPTLLLVRTTKDYVFGAYCSTALEERNLRDQSGHRQTYFGTGETFVFSLKPTIAKHQWVGITQQEENKELSHVAHSSELFIHADSDMISIGGGNGQALYLDHELRFGKSEKCETFDNPPLCPDIDFEVKVIEVYGLSEPM